VQRITELSPLYLCGKRIFWFSVTTKLAKVNDQMIPLLVMQILKDIPGLSGLFIAGVFSGKLLMNNVYFFIFKIYLLLTKCQKAFEKC
jgi:hypothetical protein